MSKRVKAIASGKDIINCDITKLGSIGVLMGGCSSEREVSLKSGKAVYAALKSCGCYVSSLDIKQENEGAIESLLRKSKIRVAFIALHGRFGEDGTIQAISTKIGIPYTGSGIEASYNALNKVISQKIFKNNDVPVPPFLVIKKDEKLKVTEILKNFKDYPVVVKPACEGSSIGITFAYQKKELKKAVNKAFRYDSEVLLERYIGGREMTVGIVANEPLPVIEIKPKRQFFDFTAKYSEGMTEYIVPAKVSGELSCKLQKIALKAHRSLSCKDFSRVDIMLDKHSNPYVLEVNTIPGFTATSLLPKAAKVAGMNFTQLCLKLIELAYEKEK